MRLYRVFPAYSRILQLDTPRHRSPISELHLENMSDRKSKRPRELTLQTFHSLIFLVSLSLSFSIPRSPFALKVCSLRSYMN